MIVTLSHVKSTLWNLNGKNVIDCLNREGKNPIVSNIAGQNIFKSRPLYFQGVATLGHDYYRGATFRGRPLYFQGVATFGDVATLGALLSKADHCKG